jgi:lipopolysaccharide transport system ATP-binding protein
MLQHKPSAASGGPVRVELQNVTKRFMVYPEQHRSFQETFIRLFRRRRSSGHEFWPLRDVSFEINQGDFLGVIGRNGSGKSTLLKLISRIIDPTSGTIKVQGRIASLLELGAGFHPELTGRENIYLNGSVYGLSRAEIRSRAKDIIAFSELAEFIDVPLKHYSSGMYVRLGFAVAVHTNPDLLLVDEVLAVGDADFQSKCLDAIQKFRASGGTMVLVSHDLATIQNLCSRALWLEDGLVQAFGQPTDVVMSYLRYLADDREKGQLQQPVSGRRWGTGKVQVTDLKLFDGEDQSQGVFKNGDDVEVRIYYRAKESIDGPVFGLAIHDQNGIHISGPNSDFGGVQIPRVEGDGVICYRIPALPLLEGSYLISVSCHNREDTEMYDYQDRVYPFRVGRGASPERYGLVTLRGEWYPVPVTAPPTDNRPLEGVVAS